MFEIKFVVVLIGVVSTLVVSASVKAHKLSQGRHVLDDCRQMDLAIDQWAVETSQKVGNPVDAAAVRTHLKTPWSAVDALGNHYNVTVVGRNQISISSVTKASLAGADIDWGAY